MLLGGQFENLDEPSRIAKAKKLLNGFALAEKDLKTLIEKYDESRSDFYSVR